MGKCIFCGVDAGWFCSQHKECVERHAAKLIEVQALKDSQAAEARQKERDLEAAKVKLRDDASATIRSGGDLNALELRLFDAVDSQVITFAEKSAILISAFTHAIDHALDDGILSDDEDGRLESFLQRFAFSRESLDITGAYSKLAKSRILKTVLANQLPAAISVNGCAVNFQKNETPVWRFAETQYMEDIVRKQYVGGSQGMSFRIMSGVYYRIGGFKGESISTLQRKHLGPGELILTDRNIYFAGYGKTTRIPYSKITSFTPFSDGFGLMRDAATAKPQFFIVGDGWFAYNLVTNLAKLY